MELLKSYLQIECETNSDIHWRTHIHARDVFFSQISRCEIYSDSLQQHSHSYCILAIYEFN